MMIQIIDTDLKNRKRKFNVNSSPTIYYIEASNIDNFSVNVRQIFGPTCLVKT